MGDLLHDIRLAFRSLLATPSYSIIIVVTLALGIGATTAIFSVAYGVLLRPLPYADSSTLVVIEGERDFPNGTRIANFSAAELSDWIAHSRAFVSVAGHEPSMQALRTPAGIVAVRARTVSDAFFTTLGQPMALGRALGNDADAVAVVTDAFWRRHLDADPNAIGREIVLSSRSYTVVGVTRPDFRFPADGAELYLPLAHLLRLPDGARLANRNRGGFSMIARLRPGITLVDAQRDAAHVVKVLEPHFAEFRRGTRARITPISSYLASTIDVSGRRTTVAPALLVLLGAAMLVLLIACANVAHVTLARQTARARELAIRVALGSSRARLVSHAIAESLVTGAAGGIAGVALAYGAIAALQRLRPQIPRLEDVAVDGPVLWFAGGASIAAALLASAAPAMRTSAGRLASTLASGGRTLAGNAGARRARSILIVAELSLAIVLLVGAILLARSFVSLVNTDLGVDRTRIISAQMDVNFNRTLPEARWVTLAGAIVDRVSALPGVQAVGAGSGLPPDSLYMRRSFVRADPVTGQPVDHLVSLVPATPGYFTTLGISLVRGRLFTDADGAAAPPVVIITDDLARRFFGDRDPLGETLPIGPAAGAPSAPVTIVGVVKNVKYTGIDSAIEGVLYRPFAQNPWRVVFVVARTAGDPESIRGELRGVARSVDPEINLMNVRTLDEAVGDAVAQPRFRTAVLVAMASLAIVLATIGLYGVVAYSIAQRTTEFGVRVAMGATASDVMRQVLREGMRLALAGGAIGVALAAAAAQLLRGLLYGTTPADPWSFGIAAGALMVVSLIATAVPALRATRIDPIVALREG